MKNGNLEKNVEVWEKCGNLETLRIFGTLEKIEIWRKKFGNLKFLLKFGKKLETWKKFGYLENIWNQFGNLENI